MNIFLLDKDPNDMTDAEKKALEDALKDKDPKDLPMIKSAYHGKKKKGDK